MFAQLSIRLALFVSGAAATSTGTGGGPDLAEPLTLQAAVAYAQSHAPAVGSARAQVLAAQAQQDTAWASWFPTLGASLATSVGGQANQTHYSATSTSCVDPTSGCGRQTGSLLSGNANARVGANWTLFEFGQRAAAGRAADHLVGAATADADTVRLQAGAVAATAFWQQAAAEELVAAQERIVQSRTRALAVTEERVAVGVAAPIEATRARVSVQTAALDVAAARTTLATARTALAQALGLDPTRQVRIAPDDGGPRVLPTPAEAADIAERRRPELRASRQRLVAQEAGIDRARARFLPSLQATLSAAAAAGAFTTPTVNTSESVTAGLVLDIPLFDLSLLSNLRAAEASHRAAEVDLRATQLDVRAAAVSATVEVDAQEQALAQAQTLAQVAAANLTQAEGRHREGAGTLLELVDAQEQDAQAQINLIRARYQLRLAQQQLDVALARDLNPP